MTITYITGTSGDDSYILARGSYNITTGAGDDLIIEDVVDNLYDEYYMGNGDDFVFLTGGTDLVRLGAGNDEVIAQGTLSTLYGGAGDDNFFIGDGNSQIYGGEDYDTVFLTNTHSWTIETIDNQTIASYGDQIVTMQGVEQIILQSPI